MTIQQYYELQAKLVALEKGLQSFDDALEDVRTTFNAIDVNQLINQVTIQPTQNLPVPAVPPTLTPVVQPKQRKKLNAPVLTGPLKDVVEDMLSQKAADEEAASAPKRIAPYEVGVKSVGIGPGGQFYATVFDVKNNEEAMIEVPRSTYDEFQRDPDGLVIDLNGYMLEKAEWLPVNMEPNTTAQAVTTEA